MYGRRRLVKALPEKLYLVRVKTSTWEDVHGPYATRAGARTVASNKLNYYIQKLRSTEWTNNWYSRATPEPLPEVPEVTILETDAEWSEVDA